MSSLLQASLSAPVASPAWQQQLGNQLTGLAQRGRQQIELHLNPADLGPLSVSLKVDDHGAQAQFLSAHATVRAAVEQAIPQLREALAEQGIALGEASVGEQQQHGNEQSSGTGQGPVRSTAAVGAGDATDGTVEAAATALPGDLPGVDIYA
jgi:flagellar hook-length control protein FliK